MKFRFILRNSIGIVAGNKKSLHPCRPLTRSAALREVNPVEFSKENSRKPAQPVLKDEKHEGPH